MAQYIIIVKNTDLRCPNFRFLYARSLKQAANELAYMRKSLCPPDNPEGYAFPASSDESLPGPSQNFHHRVIEGVYLVEGVNLCNEAKKLKREYVKRCGPSWSSTYGEPNWYAEAVYKFGKEVAIP